MKNYYYDSQGIYTEERNSHLDRLQTEIDKKFVWLCPANATHVVPMNEEDGKARVFDGEKWELKGDIRGTYYSTENGNKTNIKDINFDLTGLTKLPRPDECHIWKKDKWIISQDLQTQKVEDDRIKEIKQLILSEEKKIITEQAIQSLKDNNKITDEDIALFNIK